MNYLFLFLFFLFFIPSVSGYDGIFSILDEKYADTVLDLPYSEGSPDISWQYSPGNIDYRWGKAWLDITGFEGLIKFNSSFYVNDSPADRAIVQYGYKGLRGTTVSWTPVLRTYQSGENIIAELTLKRSWTEMFCNGDSCYPVSHSGTMTISDSELIPLIYPSLQGGSVNVTEYNNSFNPKTVISLNCPGNVSRITYRYDDNSLTNTVMIGHVEQTNKGIYYLNFTQTNIWTDNTDSLKRFNTWVVIPNSSSPDYANLSIEISNPYNTIVVNNFSHQRITYNPESTFSNPLLMFVSMLLTFFISSIIIIRRI